ncbi:CoA transferase [Sulfidibacter corallicola]|uniref:CoA transferase n=1 Tax=Sulfidibacter corallicola TaxID=2818388 RepID=A0A8A4TX40_SULCO|nr:CoA transferase [Sulfidibacter corallicola]QTD53771.1 CoA transferase [Sulfidibacter corallicola]
MMYLEGVRVLDLSRILAGPFCTQNLADMGADVLKIEAPGGDDTRTWGPPFQGDMAAYFQSCNRNKSSLVLDLKTDDGAARLARLIEVADVVVDNFPPGVRRRLGLSRSRIAELNPRAVTMSITGYRGDRAQEPGYDIMIQAESGMMGITGPRGDRGGEEAFKVGVALVDVLTGLMAANGILAALFRRERTGEAAALSVTLYQTALMSLINVAANYLVSGKPSARWGNEHPNIVPYQSFRLKDRSIIIGAGNDTQFRRLSLLLGFEEPEWLARSNADRVAHREEVIGRLSAVLADWESERLMALLKREKIPHAPILRPDEALSQVSTWDPSALLALDHAELGTVRLPAPALEGTGMRTAHQAPPRLGEGGEAMAARWLEP